MPTSPWKEGDTARAIQFWADYQELHDVSDRHGQAVGIDPVSGRVWFGESAIDVVERARADGVKPPFYFLRVGYDYYQRKGGASVIQGSVSADGFPICLSLVSIHTRSTVGGAMLSRASSEAIFCPNPAKA